MGRQTRTVREAHGGYARDDVTRTTTGTTVVSLPNYGVTIIDSTAANTWTLGPPSEGVHKYIVSSSSIAAARVVQLSVDGSASVKVGNQLHTRITFNSTVMQTVHLLGLNSTQWACVSASPETAAVNSTGIVFATS